MAGLNNSLDVTTDEGEVVVTLHNLLVGGARLEDASELTAQAYKEHDIHEHGTNLMVEHNPNSNEHTSPSRYRLTGHRMLENPTVYYPSRYRHENNDKVPQGGNTIETIQADSRRERTNQERIEKRKEGETRAAASEAADVTNDTDLTRRPKEKSAGTHLRQSAKWPGKGYEVANVTHDTVLTQKTKEKSAGTHPRRSAKWPGAGYEVADLTQEAQVRGKKEEKSTEAQSKTVARRHKAGYEIAE